LTLLFEYYRKKILKGGRYSSLTTEIAETKVWFYEGICCEEENRKALGLLRNAGIPVAWIGVKELEQFPHIEWGHLRYEGLKSITRFVEQWKKGDMPPPLLPMTLGKREERRIGRENRTDQAVALARVIKHKDPELKHAFTPEVAEKISEEERRRKMDEKESQVTIIGPIHLLGPASPNCPRCGALPQEHEVRNYDAVMRDGDVYCTACGTFVRYYDAG